MAVSMNSSATAAHPVQAEKPRYSRQDARFRVERGYGTIRVPHRTAVRPTARPCAKTAAS